MFKVDFFFQGLGEQPVKGLVQALEAGTNRLCSVRVQTSIVSAQIWPVHWWAPVWNSWIEETSNVPGPN